MYRKLKLACLNGIACFAVPNQVETNVVWVSEISKYLPYISPMISNLLDITCWDFLFLYI